jgi:hypothetical protein
METMNFVNFTADRRGASGSHPDRCGQPRGIEWHVQALSGSPATGRPRGVGWGV